MNDNFKIYENEDEFIESLNLMFISLNENTKPIIIKLLEDITIQNKHYIFSMNLAPNLLSELMKITENEKWSEETATNIIDGIEGFINGLFDSGNWKKFNFTFEIKEIANIILHNIYTRIDDITIDFPIYIKCKICKKLNENNYCDICN